VTGTGKRFITIWPAFSPYCCCRGDGGRSPASASSSCSSSSKLPSALVFMELRLPLKTSGYSSTYSTWIPRRAYLRAPGDPEAGSK
jgi:hypothetical protein